MYDYKSQVTHKISRALFQYHTSAQILKAATNTKGSPKAHDMWHGVQVRILYEKSVDLEQLLYRSGWCQASIYAK